MATANSTGKNRPNPTPQAKRQAATLLRVHLHELSRAKASGGAR
jgi:hypothetical protein